MSLLDDLMIKVGADTSEAESKLGGLSGFVDRNMAKIAGAGIAAGAALEGFARSQETSNGILERAAVVTGESTDALRESVVAMVDSGFGAQDAAAGMEALIAAGIDTKEGFEAILPSMDSFSDATGTGMVESVQLFDNTLSALGIPMSEVNEHLDTMTFLSQKTTVPLAGLSKLMSQAGPDIQALGLNFEDVAVALAALDDQGIKGKAGMAAFKTAISEADGDVSKFWTSLGLTERQIETAGEALADSTGITEKFGAANEGQMTIMEKLQASAENLMFKYGDLASVASMLAPVLMSLGPIMGILTGVTKAFSFAWGMLNSVIYMSPIGWIILGILALIAVGILIWKNWETIRAVAEAVWNFIWDKIKAFAAWYWGIYTGIFEAVKNGIATGINWVRDRWNQAWSAIQQGAAAVVNWIGSIPGRIGGFFSNVASIITSPFRSAFNGIARLWNGTVGRISFSIPAWVPMIGGRSFSVPDIPMLAAGGIFDTAGLAMVGERGPELVNLPRGAQVSPLGNGAGSNRVTLELVGDEAMVQMFRKMVRVRGGNVQVVFGQ